MYGTVLFLAAIVAPGGCFQHYPGGTPAPIPVFGHRSDIPKIVQAEKKLRGAELGVLHGTFSRETLEIWSHAVEYVLVDLWAPQENYADLNNVNAREQDDRMGAAVFNTATWKDKVVICRNFTTVCAKRFENEHFDYLYVDARHDRKGVLEDLEAWWPKMAAGGLVCGHDFVTQDEGPEQTGQDWTLNFDGTVDVTRRAVKGAVEDWAARFGRQIQVSYRSPEFPSWCIRK